MVSLNPNHSSKNLKRSSELETATTIYFDQPIGMAALPGLGSIPTVTTTTSTATTTTACSEDLSKKTRKPYTITKSRESWTEQEHDKFLEALQLFDRDWKKIEAFVGSKTVIQIRSHAQKYFLKVQKNGTSEHVPPPRPKRKAAHPYPQKASKNTPVLSQVMGAIQSSSPLLEPGQVLRPNPPSVPRHPGTSVAVSSWAHTPALPAGLSHTTKDDVGSAGPTTVNNCCSSTESTPKPFPGRGATDQGNHAPPLRVMPDFAQVYSFIGSVFDPNTSGHLKKLKEMDPIDVETVLLLMRNLSMNLTSPDFEDHRRLLSSYDVESDKAKPVAASTGESG